MALSRMLLTRHCICLRVYASTPYETMKYGEVISGTAYANWLFAICITLPVHMCPYAWALGANMSKPQASSDMHYALSNECNW